MPKVNKKAQGGIEGISGIAITLIVLAITLGLLAAINSSFSSNMQNSVGTNPNQTFTFTSGNGSFDLSAGKLGIASVVVYAQQPSLVLSSNNYSVNANTNTIVFFNDTATNWYNGTSLVNVSYTYYIGSTARNISDMGVQSTKTVASYMPLVALVAIASILVGLAMFYLFKKGQD